VCAVTHVLLPVTVLGRRKDTAPVIWAGLVAGAAGAGHRRVADLLGRPVGTVRGWLRRFALRAEEIRRVFTVVGVGLDPDPVPPAATGSAAGDAVAAVLFAAGAAGGIGDLWRPAGPARLPDVDQHERPLAADWLISDPFPACHQRRARGKASQGHELC